MKVREKTLWMLLALAVAGCGGAGDAAEDEAMAGEEQGAAVAEDPDIAPAGESTGLPAGFELRLDNADATAADYRVMDMGGTLHVQTGPAGILYNASNTATDADFEATAEFTEVGAPADHREAYGIFVGGSDLQGAGQQYTYFVIRATGEYLIKRRQGEETTTVVDWTAAPAITASTGGADLTNALSVRKQGETVHFLINGTEVTTVPAADIDTNGMAGVRVNHNLNVMVNGWTFSTM
ncbi:MAG: hypothetical protein ACREL7_13545 [Longimicrobiales bacterium]